MVSEAAAYWARRRAAWRRVRAMRALEDLGGRVVTVALRRNINYLDVSAEAGVTPTEPYRAVHRSPELSARAANALATWAGW